MAKLTRKSFLVSSAVAVGGAGLLPRWATAATNGATPPLSVDASAAPPAPQTGVLQMGSSAATRSPGGETLTVNNQYLVLNGQPWLPISGEVAYARFPAADWEASLRTMKAAGVDIVATYTPWIFHEEIQNEFVFTGDRDLRRFLSLCQALGLRVVLRPGPYSHAELRNGGIPDWVVANSTPQSTDPAFMSFVKSFWTQVAQAAQGMMWKDGGPIIGIQIENEYGATGPGKGPAYIAALKQLAISLGFDAPFYVFEVNNNWRDFTPETLIPLGGGYQALPWDTSLTELPPNPTYEFTYTEPTAYAPVPQPPADTYPMLALEFGGGTASMYRRRCVMNLPDDIAATVPVAVGSGYNLYGYYMFQGGGNPLGRRDTLQESVAEGDQYAAYNDLPIVNYDYQAPLGQFGEQRPSLGRVKLFHYFLREHGQALAAMSVRQPAVVASGAGDMSTLRWSVRSDGRRGFLFLNNYVRHYTFADHPGTRFSVKFADETLTFPSTGVDIANGTYGIWPLNMPMADARLSYATAQPITSVQDEGRTVYVFAAQDGISPELRFAGDTVSHIRARAQVADDGKGGTIVTGITPGPGVAVQVMTAAHHQLDIVVLSQSEADALWRLDLDGRELLVLTEQSFTPTPSGFSLGSVGSSQFAFATLPAIHGPGSGRSWRYREGPRRDDVFTHYEAQARPQAPARVSLRQLRAPQPAPPVKLGGPTGGALEPLDPVIQQAQGVWEVRLTIDDRHQSAEDLFLTIDYAGDLARIYDGSVQDPTGGTLGSGLLDDHFYDGQSWVVSLNGLERRAGHQVRVFTLAVMPLRSDAPIFLEPGAAPTYDSSGQACSLSDVRVQPSYTLEVDVR